ncbi:TolC family protein, partial [Neisseria sp. P0006.S010]|uniref:TolC family protein n=1 Tax=Neisseria sp. P0006.S010 TaxID=3436693 RepID=UPI003F81821D
FNERYAEEAMAFAQRVLQNRESNYKLSQLRHKAGVISSVDLRQQEALIESAKSYYASALKNREKARKYLAMLINQPL